MDRRTDKEYSPEPQKCNRCGCDAVTHTYSIPVQYDEYTYSGKFRYRQRNTITVSFGLCEKCNRELGFPEGKAMLSGEDIVKARNFVQSISRITQ